MFRSRMWGIGWNPSSAAELATRRGRGSHSLAEKVCAAGLTSVPGRTARLKAIYLLQIAAEIEHALMAQYLYAAYSIDEQFAEGRDDRLLAVVNRWKRDIRLIARQEMAHLITVQNLLISLGADIYVNRENNFLLHPDAYPFPVRFEPLSVKSLAKYVVTESPELSEIHSKSDKRVLEQAMKMVKTDLKMKINRVGVVYLTLYWLFQKSDSSEGRWQMRPSLASCMESAGLLGVHLQDRDFVSLRSFKDFEATAQEWGVFEKEMKVSETNPRQRALAAIDWIMAQGEGPIGMENDAGRAGNLSHFKRFLRIFEEFKSHESSYREAILPVPLNPFVSDRRHVGAPHGIRNSITEPESRLWAQLFNLRYQMLLVDILLALTANRRQESDLRRKLVGWAVQEMKYLGIVGQILPTRRRHTGSRTVSGAPFETIEMPLDAAKRWDLQRVLMKGSQHLTKRLRQVTEQAPDVQEVLESMRKFDAGRRGFVEAKSTVPGKYDWVSGRVTRKTRAEEA